MAPLTTIDPGPVGALRIAPSILSADFGELAEAIAMVTPEADWLHVDVMDGHFVQSIRKHTELYLDCHLMITDPGEYLEAFAKAGAQGVTVHAEIGDLDAVIDQARSLGLRIGVAVNPDTEFSLFERYLDQIDLVLCMTVFPGFGGQSFIHDVLPKIAQVRAAVDERGLNVEIQVDGGIDVTTTPLVIAAGANVLVAGSAIFTAPHPVEAAKAIRTAAQSAAGAR